MRRKTHTQIIALLSDGTKHISQRQIAEITGCSRMTVTRVASRLRNDTVGMEDKLAEIQREIAEKMPGKARVERMVQLAQQGQSPIVAYKATIRLDDLSGIQVPENEAEKPQHQPMFQLPQGSIVQVHIATPVQNQNPQDEVKEIKPFSPSR